MLRVTILLFVFTAFTLLLFTACQQEPFPVEPVQNTTQQTQLPKIMIPVGATIDSAAFYINVTTAMDEEVTLHRVTSDWDEMMVTWNNFAGGFNAGIEGSFTPAAAGWYAVDVTGLVTDWFDETYPNYGILLKEESPDQLQYYSSREAGMSSYLKIWWTMNGSNGADSTDAFADSYINSGLGDMNFGDADDLITGWDTTAELQTLVRFEIEQTSGCTRSYGYWKTHSMYGPAPYDSTWELLGEDSTFFLSNKSNYEVMWTPPKGGNAYYILAHQYIAAELNFLSGADPGEIQEEFDDATDLFETYTPEYIKSLKGNDPVRQEFIYLSGMLDQYNNGYIGPGKCNESYAEYPFKIK
jgi:hypothetical protein